MTRWRTLKRHVALYWSVLLGRDLPCDDAFDDVPHRQHDWVGATTGRTYHCGGHQ
jgi:hypothetical protein